MLYLLSRTYYFHLNFGEAVFSFPPFSLAHNKEKCSTCLVIDSTITDECLSGVLPPYPICCLAQNATELIAKAQESSTRCCSPPAAADLELCSEYDMNMFMYNVCNHMIIL